MANRSSVVLVCLMTLRDWYVDLSCPPNPLASLLGGGEVWSLGGVWGMYNVPKLRSIVLMLSHVWLSATLWTVAH